jgi:hypothetical protein
MTNKTDEHTREKTVAEDRRRRNTVFWNGFRTRDEEKEHERDPEQPSRWHVSPSSSAEQTDKTGANTHKRTKKERKKWAESRGDWFASHGHKARLRREVEDEAACS